MRDFEAYYAAGSATRAGVDAYGRAIWNYERSIEGVNPSRYEVLPFVGPPPSLIVWKAIAAVPYNVAVHLWQGLLGFCAVLAAFLTARLCKLRFSLLTALALVPVFFAFGPLTSDLALGQIALPAFAAVLVAVTLENRFALGAAVAGAVGFFQPNVGITIAGLAKTRRGILIGVLSLLVFLETFALSGGFGRLFEYAGVLQYHGTAERFSLIQITPAAVAFGFGLTPQIAQVIGGVVALAATVAWFIVVRNISSSTQCFAFTCAIAPLSMPFFHEHDLLVVAVPALFLALRCGGPLALAGFFLCSIDWLGLAQRPDGTVQTVLLAAAGLLGLLTLHAYKRSQVVAPLCIIAAAALFGGIAAAHPLPIWPDAMKRFAAPASYVPLWQIWEAEQRATGLLAPNAFSALLRVLPLAGCALLSWQLYRLRVADLADSKTPYSVPAANL